MRKTEKTLGPEASDTRFGSGSMREAAPARTALVDAAARMFQRNGYHGSGLNALLAESRTPKGSLYYYFPEGKEQLADEAIRMAAKQIASVIDRSFASADTFAVGAACMANTVADWFEASDYGEGCPITSVLLETVPTSDRLTRACQDVIQSWISVVASHARRMGHDGEADYLGTSVVMTIELSLIHI